MIVKFVGCWCWQRHASFPNPMTDKKVYKFNWSFLPLFNDVQTGLWNILLQCDTCVVKFDPTWVDNKVSVSLLSASNGSDLNIMYNTIFLESKQESFGRILVTKRVKNSQIYVYEQGLCWHYLGQILLLKGQLIFWQLFQTSTSNITHNTWQSINNKIDQFLRELNAKRFDSAH